MKDEINILLGEIPYRWRRMEKRVPNRDELVNAAKKMLQNKGVKWSSTHKLALNEILDLIDDEFLGNYEKNLAEQMHQYDIYCAKIEDLMKNLNEKEAEVNKKQDALDKQKALLMDDRQRKALNFAREISEIYAGLDQEVMQCVSYSVWAYLGGGTDIPPAHDSD